LRNDKACAEPESDAAEAGNVKRTILDEKRIVVDDDETEQWTTENNRALPDGRKDLGAPGLCRIKAERAASFRAPPDFQCIGHGGFLEDSQLTPF
jgi:hypothetical protein